MSVRGTSNLFLGTVLGDVFGAVIWFSVCSDESVTVCRRFFREECAFIRPRFRGRGSGGDGDRQSGEREGSLILLEIFVRDRRKVAFLAWKKAAGTIAKRQSADRHESELIRPFA